MCADENNPPKLSRVEAPTTTVWLAERGTNGTGAANEAGRVESFDNYWNVSSSTPPSIFGNGSGTGAGVYGANVEARHLETANVVYADGHAKAHRLSYLITRNAAGNQLRYWNYADD
jgi:prepilin-type processing-associated H-X9-DG protein